MIKIGSKEFDKNKTYIMGILNVTPDSFSDGGRFVTMDKVLERAEEMVHDDNNLTEIIWPVKPECPIEEMPAYAEAYAKAFNDAVATQDFKYAVSSDDSYGGYWDSHDMDVQVYYERDIMEPENYWVNQIVPAGSNDPIMLNPNLEQ